MRFLETSQLTCLNIQLAYKPTRRLQGFIIFVLTSPISFSMLQSWVVPGVRHTQVQSNLVCLSLQPHKTWIQSPYQTLNQHLGFYSFLEVCYFKKRGPSKCLILTTVLHVSLTQTLFHPVIILCTSKLTQPKLY